MNQRSQKIAMEQKKIMKETVQTKDKSMVEENKSSEGNAMMKEDAGMMNSYLGTIIAGKTSPYIVFNKADYDKAMLSGKIIFLEFYANWCPICRAQASKLVEGFNTLTDEHIVGFRVNYNDDETDEIEKQLAKDFGVTYQHTHVILKDGKVVSKSNDDLDKDSFVELIKNATK
jgi:thiol-disulfide isomerase/thioredoxin